MTEISQNDLHRAVDRIARSEDGHLLYRYFQQALCGVLVNAADGALREDNGRRRFASELMGLMAKGIEESGGPGTTSKPVTFSRQQPAASGKRVTAREWLSTAEPGAPE